MHFIVVNVPVLQIPEQIVEVIKVLFERFFFERRAVPLTGGWLWFACTGTGVCTGGRARSSHRLISTQHAITHHVLWHSKDCQIDSSLSCGAWPFFVGGII